MQSFAVARPPYQHPDADYINDLVKQAGLKNATQLANKAGLPQSTLNRKLSGEDTSLLKPQTRRRLEEAAGSTVVRLPALRGDLDRAKLRDSIVFILTRLKSSPKAVNPRVNIELVADSILAHYEDTTGQKPDPDKAETEAAQIIDFHLRSLDR